MHYFARIAVQHRPANKLQAYLFSQVEKFDNILLNDPADLFKQIEAAANSAAYTYRRCARVTPRLNRDYKTKDVESITAMGLFTLTFHKVAGHFPPITEAQTVTAAQAAAPEPEPPTPPSCQPRQEVWESRENQKIIGFENFGKFSPTVQKLLQAGKVWGIYQHAVLAGKLVVEEYGGQTHSAYAD